MKVNLIFRKPNPIYFSIEKVFETIIPFFPESVSVNRVFVPSDRADIRSLLKNILSGFKKAAIYHITGDVHYMAISFPSKKTILTIHDSIFMIQNSGLKRILLQWLWLKIPVRKAKYVTVISEASRQDVIRYTGCNPEKVIVVPDPVGTNFQYVLKEFNKHKPRILQMGTWPNKNLERVIEALKGLRCELVIVGQLSDHYKSLLIKADIEYISMWKISEADLLNQYQLADLIIFASTFEGFGLPIIEAQATGRVVITSDLLPMSEVAGEAAILVDPYNIDAIRAGIDKAINDDETRNKLIRKGLENVKRYSPTVVADQYYQIYKRVERNINSN